MIAYWSSTYINLGIEAAHSASSNYSEMRANRIRREVVRSILWVLTGALCPSSNPWDRWVEEKKNRLRASMETLVKGVVCSYI